MTAITLFLPLPVSLNKAYANVTKVGRVKTHGARCWRTQAMHYVVPFLHSYRRVCDANVITRHRYTTQRGQRGKPCIDLHGLKAAHPELAYAVTYTYHFPDDSTPRDVFNFEKLLTDLLVELGFFLDDNFIVDGRVKLGKPDPKNPRCEIEILSLDRAAFFGVQS